MQSDDWSLQCKSSVMCRDCETSVFARLSLLELVLRMCSLLMPMLSAITGITELATDCEWSSCKFRI